MGPARTTSRSHTGEICVRGPQVMKGYWNNPEETAKVFGDGWLKTGDVGYMDAKGYVTLTDRKKEIILVSGFNVYPNEIEGVVATHPGVLECGVVGVPDEKTGEAVMVFVVKKDPGPDPRVRDRALQGAADRLQVAASGRVHRRCCPSRTIGKVLRRELRDGPSKDG